MGFTRVLAQEVGSHGITANCACPGITVTDMGRTDLADQANVDRWVGVTALRPTGICGRVGRLPGVRRFGLRDGQRLNVCGGIVLS